MKNLFPLIFIIILVLACRTEDASQYEKPNIIFFSEMIPIQVSQLSFAAAEKADVMLLVGTTGEVMPAALLPNTAKESNQAIIIEVNPEPSLYTQEITDIFLQGKAGEIVPILAKLIFQ